MLAPDSPRPAKLYQYADRATLERALALGEFRLVPVAPAAGLAGAPTQILPFRPKTPAASGSYLTLRLTRNWDETQFDAEAGHDCCLVIHDAEQFGERLHQAAQRALPNWAGIDAAVSYGEASPLGAAFTRARQLARQAEWLFAWRPIQPTTAVHPIVVQIGNLEAIAELRGKTN